MNYFEILKKLNPRIGELNEQPIILNSETVGWNSYLHLKNGHPYAGGTALTRELARRICVAEAFERSLFHSFQDEPSLLLNEYPSTCGFACGFEKEATRLRSLAEGLERWVWSQWIDHGFIMPEIDSSSIIATSLDQNLINQFDSIRYFHKQFNFEVGKTPYKLQFNGVVGYKDDGAFPGSRVTNLDDMSFQHGLSEAARNLRNFSLHGRLQYSPGKNNMADIRNLYFGSHAEEATAQLFAARRSPWPAPEVLVAREIATNIDGIYLWRTLFSNFIGWHHGKESRFVY